MEVTSATTAATPQTQAASTGNQSGVLSSDFETFLMMLTTQMQNQDPLDPVKSEDFAVQLATFSSVEQQVLTNDLLESLSGQMSLMGIAQLSGWVGMEVRAAVPAQFDGSPITVAPNPPVVSDLVQLVVKDANGNEVQRTDIPVSSEPIEWDGLDSDGTSFSHGEYTFWIESFSNGEPLITDPAEVYVHVVEATSQGGETVLVTEGGNRIPASSVTGLREAQDGSGA